MNDNNGMNRIVSAAVLMIAVVSITAVLPTLMSEYRTLIGDSPRETDPVPQPEDAPMDWSWLKYVGIGIAVVVVLAILVFVGYRIVARRSRVHSAAEAEREVRAAQVERWGKGSAAYEYVALGITEFETDPETIFTRPLLLDTSEPATAALFDAFHEVGKLHLENVPRDEALITAYVDAATAAKRAFVRANQNAQTKARAGITSGDRRLTAGETRNLERAKGLLRVALDPATENAHARNAYEKVTELLAGIITIPAKFEDQLVRSIESVHRPELISGTPEPCERRGGESAMIPPRTVRFNGTSASDRAPRITPRTRYGSRRGRVVDSRARLSSRSA